MFMKTITLATFATGAMARSLKQDDRGLLLAVQKPTIQANSTSDEVTVSWKTGPSATTESYTVSCFDITGVEPYTCLNYPLPVADLTASGELEKALLPSTVEETFPFADAVVDDVVQCFIEVEGQFGYANKCIDLEATFEGADVTRSIEADPERLFAVVQKPTVEADYELQEVTVSWMTGPAAVGGSYTVSCFDITDTEPYTCLNYPTPDPLASTTGDYEKTLLKDEYTEVFGYDAVVDTVVQCFIEAEGEYGLTKCKDAGEATYVSADRLAGSIIKPTTVATGAGAGEVSFETIGAVEYDYAIECYDKTGMDANDIFLTCLPLAAKTAFVDAADYLIGETEGTTDLGKSTTTWEFSDVEMVDRTAQCFVFTAGPYGKLDKCMSAGEALLEGNLRSLEADPERLFAVVQKPTVEADYELQEVTVSWMTGPAAVGGSYTVSCFDITGVEPYTCLNYPTPDPLASTTGDYEKTLLKDEYTEVFGYDAVVDTVVQCFIEAEGEYGLTKCKDAGEATYVGPV